MPRKMPFIFMPITPIAAQKNLKELVSHAWSLQEISEHYHQFISLFRPLALLLKENTDAQIS